MSRACPLCASAESTVVVRMRADAIVAGSSYRSDALEVLGIDAGEEFPVVRCGTCGLVYSARLLAPQVLERLYDEAIAEEEDLRHERSRERLVAYSAIWCSLVEDLPEEFGEDRQPAGLRVLDYGAGYGTLLEVVRSPGVEVFAYETSARRRAFLSDRGIRALGDDAELGDGAPYHFIICNQVLEHVPDPLAVLSRLASVLHRSGRAYVAVPYCSDEVLVAQVEEYHREGRTSADLNPWEHLNYFSPRAFQALLTRCGLRVRRWPLVCPRVEEGRVVLGYVPAAFPATHWTGAVVERSR